MDWTQNSIGHVVGIAPWLLFLLGVAWYAVRGVVADLREGPPRRAARPRSRTGPAGRRAPAARKAPAAR
jgi:hypothetical protein